jgi:hypothetical protein
MANSQKQQAPWPRGQSMVFAQPRYAASSMSAPLQAFKLLDAGQLLCRRRLRCHLALLQSRGSVHVLHTLSPWRRSNVVVSSSARAIGEVVLA